MKRVPSKPTVLTPSERQTLNKWLYLEDWHFEVLFLSRCTEMSSFAIEGTGGWEYAKVYGLRAVRRDSQRPCIANIFVRYEYRVFRVHDIEAAGNLIQLLRKEADYERYQERQWKKRREEKKKKKMVVRELKAA